MYLKCAAPRPRGAQPVTVPLYVASACCSFTEETARSIPLIYMHTKQPHFRTRYSCMQLPNLAVGCWNLVWPAIPYFLPPKISCTCTFSRASVSTTQLYKTSSCMHEQA